MMLGYGMFGGWVSMLLWVAIVIVVIYLAIRLFDKNDSDTKSHSSLSNAEQILKERYARGEIDTNTFQEMNQNLKK